MKQKLDSIQALRAIACLTVFLNHCYIGNVVMWGVSVFFVMSGFLMTVRHLDSGDSFSVAPRDCLRFSWSRIKKLYPLYIITLLPVLILNIVGKLVGYSDESFFRILRELVFSLLLIQSWLPRYCMVFNGVAWYLSTAFFLYFCFPCILRCVSRFRKKSSAYLAIAALFALEGFFSFLAPSIGRLFPALFPSDPEMSFEMWFTYIFPPFRLIDFTLGCSLGFLFLRRNKPEKSSVINLIDIAALFIFAVSIAVCRLTEELPVSECYKYSLLFSPFALFSVYSFALGKGFLPRLLTNRYTVALGNISASFYLIHQDIIRAMLMLWGYTSLPVPVFKAILIPSAFLLTVFASMLYRFAAERCRKRL